MGEGNENDHILEASPMKKRRGRPSSKKNIVNIIGESTMPIEVNSISKESAHELSQAAERQGFCSTPLMRLSPSKEATLSSSASSNTSKFISKISKSKTKSNLHELTIELQSDVITSGSHASVTKLKIPKKPSNSNSNELYFINSKISFDNNTSSPTLTMTPQRTLKNQSSSSPLSNHMMSSDTVFQSSSPLQTSPIPSEKIIGMNKSRSITTNLEIGSANNNHNGNLSLHSSPLYHSTTNNSNNPYDDQIFKYINSSPISTANGYTNRYNANNIINHKGLMIGVPDGVYADQYNIDNLMKHQRNSIRVNKRTGSNKKVLNFQKANKYRYNLSYRYKLTLDIDEYGKAKIYARVIENQIPISAANYARYYYNQEGDGNSDDEEGRHAQRVGYGVRERMVINNRRSPSSSSLSSSNMEDYQPSRYDEYLDEQRKYNEQRQEIIKNSMKSDPYMTGYYTPAEYIGVLNSPRRMKYYPMKPPMTANTALSNNNPLFEDYINQEYEKVKTVNMNNIIANNKGLSAGIDVNNKTKTPDVPFSSYDTVKDEMNRVYQFRKNRVTGSGDIDENSGGDGSNDALSALKRAVLN